MKNRWKQCKIEFTGALGLVLLTALGISLIFGGYIYSGNDDAMFRSIVSGNYTGTPDAHLIFILYPLGFLLKSLYNLLSMVAWYDVFMVGSHYLCLFFLLYRVGQQFTKPLTKLIAMTVGLGLLLIVDLPYLLIPQFTVQAAMFAVTAVFWLATAQAEPGRRYWMDRGVCLFFMTLSLWVRDEIFWMALPIGFFLLQKELWTPGETENPIGIRLRRVGIFVGAMLSVMLISYTTDTLAYRGEGWQDFKIYNVARSDIYDLYGVPAYEKYAEAYDKIGISYGEWLTLDGYNGRLIEDMDGTTLAEIADWARAEAEAPRQYYSMWRKAIYIVCEIMLFQQVQPVGLLLSVAYVLYLLYCYHKDDKVGLLCACGMLVFQAAFVFYFTLLGRLVERVSYGLYLMQLVGLLGLMLRQPVHLRREAPKGRFWMVSGGVLACVFLAVVGLYRIRTTMDEQAILEQAATNWRYVNAYCSEQEDARYCLITRSFVGSAEELFAGGSVESANVIRLGTWAQHSPLEQAREEAQGVHRLVEQLATEEQFYLVQSAESSYEWMNQFWQEKGYDVTATVVDTFTVPGGEQFRVIGLK